jgi:hypothetical protein
MAEMKVEVFREDVDNLTKKLMKVIQEDLGGTLYLDRSIIISASLANVACAIDVVEEQYSAECTRRLKNIANSWVY